jgi:hypothetical protein
MVLSYARQFFELTEAVVNIDNPEIGHCLNIVCISVISAFTIRPCAFNSHTVARVPGYRSRGLGIDSQCYQIF